MGLNVNSYPVCDNLFGVQPTEAGAKLKSSFEDKDRQLILLYFKWLTKKNAKNVGITQLALTSTMSASIKNFLIREGLANIKDWEFTGMVDYGVQGAVECSHGGHKLRYAYFAFSPSTGRELIFGQNCASDFFDVDIATLGSFVKVINKASRELCAVLNKGRYCREFTFTDEAVNCFKMLNHSSSMMSQNPELAAIYDDIAMRCYTYIGRTAMELWANFISRGLLLPDTLRDIVVSGYQQAVIDVLKTKPEYATALGYYLKVKDTEMFSLDKNLIKGEFISPISELSLTDALRVCILEELISPTSLANRYDLLTIYKQISLIEQLVKPYKKRYSRAEIFARQLAKAGTKDITDPLSCMLVGLIRNDLRIVTFMFGLTKGSLQPININSWETWVEDRLKIGDINPFEEVWCGDNWYGNLKRFIDARHPKRSLLVLLYCALYSSICSALTGQTKPQFHCCYLDDNYPEYPEDMGLTDIITKLKADAQSGFNNRFKNCVTADGNIDYLFDERYGYSGDADLLKEQIQNIPEDADFFSTKEDIQIRNIVDSLAISTASASDTFKRVKRRTRAKIDEVEDDSYFDDAYDDFNDFDNPKDDSLDNYKDDEDKDADALYDYKEDDEDDESIFDDAYDDDEDDDDDAQDDKQDDDDKDDDGLKYIDDDEDDFDDFDDDFSELADEKDGDTKGLDGSNVDLSSLLFGNTAGEGGADDAD